MYSIEMKRILTNAALGLFTGWLALLDHCLIVTAKSAIVGEIVVVLVLQASIIAFGILLVNGAFPIIREMATDKGSARLKIIAAAVPAIFLVFSPLMISDSIYRARYGSIDRLVVHAHVGHDLTCCLNPLRH